MEPKKNTLMEKFGFKDAELTTPKHDEIVIGLSEQKIVEIVESCEFKIEEMIEWEPIREVICQFDENTGKHACGAIGRHPPLSMTDFEHLISTNSETFSACPLINSRMKAHVLEGRREIIQFRGHPTKIINIEYEAPIKSDKFIIGFADCKAHLLSKEFNGKNVKCYKVSKDIYIEVKTAIPSFGELLRQINTYRVHTHNGLWIVVCPDDRFADAIRSQGIGFYKWEEKK